MFPPETYQSSRLKHETTSVGEREGGERERGYPLLENFPPTEFSNISQVNGHSDDS